MQSSTEEHLFLQSDSMFNDQEEVEAENYVRGKITEIQTNGLTGLEIKGKVRTLSPVLFYQTNTRYLIMSNNELKYLPAEIGNLINLVYLDLSFNRLKTLPSQIGLKNIFCEKIEIFYFSRRFNSFKTTLSRIKFSQKFTL